MEASGAGQGPPPPGGPGGAGAPSEEEMRAALEEQMRQITVDDLLLQSVASIANLTARRIAKPDEKDLAQAKRGIDAVRALVDVLPAEAAPQVRNAISELQMLYAREAGGGGEGESGEAAPGDGGQGAAGATGGEGSGPSAPQTPPPGGRRGPGEPPPRLWTPGSG